jgi:hypothetical protein
VTLPFDLPNKNKRRWQCFVCGREFTEYEQYKEHIIKEHEEGRDYVLCPLKRCGAPIRDLRMHFKAKHKKEKLPSGVQFKSTVWRDQKIIKGKKKIITKKPTFIKGVLISNKSTMRGREISYRSGYERKVYECLEVLPDVVFYDTETEKVPYYYEGERHIYLPDLKIAMADGHIEVWEIKPATQTSSPKNEAKWKAAESYCEIRGWKFVIITEVGINKLEKKVKRLIYG